VRYVAMEPAIDYPSCLDNSRLPVVCMLVVRVIPDCLLRLLFHRHRLEETTRLQAE
jgi:hypothetical protein